MSAFMHTRVTSFQTVHFKSPDPVTKEPREVILLYALGADGVVYEFNGTWTALPINPENVREHSQPAVPAPGNRLPKGL